MAENSALLSPLDQIRLAESDVTRLLTAARANSDQNLARVRLQAEQSKKEAHAAGNREGKALAKEIIIQAEEEAKVISSQGQRQSAALTRKGRQRMKEAVQFAVDFVLGLQGQDTNP